MAFEPAARHATLVSTGPLSNVRRLVDNTVCDRPTTRTHTHHRMTVRCRPTSHCAFGWTSVNQRAPHARNQWAPEVRSAIAS